MNTYWWYLMVDVSECWSFSNWTVSTMDNQGVLHTGANVQKGKSLDSPLHAAAEKDCTAIVKLLLDFGADINARNTEFQRPVDVAPPSSLTEGFLLLYEGTRTLVTCFSKQLLPYVCIYLSDLSYMCLNISSNRYTSCSFIGAWASKKSNLCVSTSLYKTELSPFHSYTTTAEPAVSSVHQELRRPWQTPPSFPPSPAQQAQELPAVPMTDRTTKQSA